MKRPDKKDYTNNPDYWTSISRKEAYHEAMERYCDWVENQLKNK